MNNNDLQQAFIRGFVKAATDTQSIMGPPSSAAMKAPNAAPLIKMPTPPKPTPMVQSGQSLATNVGQTPAMPPTNPMAGVQLGGLAGAKPSTSPALQHMDSLLGINGQSFPHDNGTMPPAAQQYYQQLTNGTIGSNATGLR